MTTPRTRFVIRITLFIVMIVSLLSTPTGGISRVGAESPSQSGTQPYPNAPLCPTHNDRQFHGLWDYARGCHYDHTHNDDPALGDSVFGPAGALWGGQSASYPWMTANENNQQGHPGYKYYVNLNPQPNCAVEGYEYLGSVNCVSAFRIQYHDAGGNAHMVKRFHSYYLEARIQRGSIVGTVQTGGWADYGCLHESYKDRFLPLPGIDPVQANGQTACGSGGQTINSDPYRAPKDTWQEIQGRTKGDNMWIWTSHNRYGYNRVGFFFFRTLDSWGSIDASDPYEEHFLCPDFRCKFNNSEHHVFNIFATIPAALDTDKDGIVNYTGYTDIKGNIVQGCTAPGENCVPLRIVNAPVGTALWSRNLSGPRPAGDPIRDHDIYFNGQPSGWIQFHSHAHTPAPTGTVPPTQTPVVAATSTSVFTPTPTVINPVTNTPLPTFTAVPANTMPPILPTNTMPPVPPTSPSNAGTIAPAALQTERGATTGSVASLGVLKQSGTDDNAGEYVTFETPGSSVYKGYLSFNPPTNIPTGSVSEVSLQVNFKGTATSKQSWIWSVYDWNTKQWVELGRASGRTQNQWQMLKFNIPMLKQYGSSQNEVRIQLRSNNESGDAKVDYQVLQLTSGSPNASAQTLVLPTTTATLIITPTSTPTSIPPLVEPSPTHTH